MILCSNPYLVIECYIAFWFGVSFFIHPHFLLSLKLLNTLLLKNSGNTTTYKAHSCQSKEDYWVGELELPKEMTSDKSRSNMRSTPCLHAEKLTVRCKAWPNLVSALMGSVISCLKDMLYS